MIVSIIKFIVLSGLITGILALVLIATNRPVVQEPQDGLDFTSVVGQDLGNIVAPQDIKMRDGYALPVRSYGDTDPHLPLVIMIHGSGWHGMQFDGLARALAEGAHILVPDLRGHGVTPQRRGDVDYIGQFEDDLADVIKAKVMPGQNVVLLGHSSGGGLVVRFAGGEHGALMDHALLLAPFLHHNAATMRPNAGGWSHVLTRRIIGLSMLNMARITALNHLPIIQFQMPQAVLDGPLGHTATLAYSYRLNTSYAPRGDYQGDIASLPNFTLIAGSADEAFIAQEYEPLMTPLTGKGRYLLIPGVTHLPIVDAPETLKAIQEDLSGL
ncbi:MAG: alpha/beta fold hydrolase [Sulfitobacter sp.]